MKKRARRHIIIGGSILLVIAIALCVVFVVRQANASRIDTLRHDESLKVLLYDYDTETAMTNEEREMLFELLEKVEYRSPTTYEKEPSAGFSQIRLRGLTDNGVAELWISGNSTNDIMVTISEKDKFETIAAIPAENYQSFMDLYYSIYLPAFTP